MDEALEHARGAAASSSTRCACAPSRSTTSVDDFVAAARPRVRGRAEPRRAAAHADGQRVRHRSGAAGAGPALRRHADHRALHRAARSPTVSRRSRSRRCARRLSIMTYHRQAQVPPSGARRRTRSGYTRRDYEGAISTLCAGCGHDSISARDHRRPASSSTMPPHRVAKLSGIGCSSKTPTYFLGNCARLQLRARPHAVGADRRQPRQPRPDLSRRLRRRRFAPRSASASSRMRSAAA